jgi:hypothetical protein
MSEELRKLVAKLKALAWDDSGLCINPDIDEIADELEAALAEKPAERPAEIFCEQCGEEITNKTYLCTICWNRVAQKATKYDELIKAERPQLSEERVRNILMDIEVGNFGMYEEFATPKAEAIVALLTGEADPSKPLYPDDRQRGIENAAAPAASGALLCSICGESAGSELHSPDFRGANRHAFVAAAPPVPQAEDKLPGWPKAHAGWSRNDKPEPVYSREFTQTIEAIRREAEQAAFEKAAQMIDTTRRDWDERTCTAIAEAIRSLAAGRKEGGR